MADYHETFAGCEIVIKNNSELIVNAAALDGSIASPGEIDRYRFDVTEFGEYTVETRDPSDTFITLYGPDDPTRELASDDDGGEGLNGRILRNLATGRYFSACVCTRQN